MKYTIVIDKHSRTMPTAEKREYAFEIGEELRRKGTVKDEIIISNNRATLIRRIGITEFFVTYILTPEMKIDLGVAKLQLFSGDNYIYVKDEFNNILKAEYVIKNEFTDTYITNFQMESAIEQSASDINLSVDKKLTGYSTTTETNAAIKISAVNINLSVDQKLNEYSTTTETNAAIKISADNINLEVAKKVNNNELSTKIIQDYESVKIAWNKISEFIQFKDAQLQIKDSSKRLLMALSKTGQEFYKPDGSIIGKIGLLNKNGKDILSFSLNTKNTNDGMAWGLTDANGNFYSIFEMYSFAFPEQGEYKGFLAMVGTLNMGNNKIILFDSAISGDIMNEVVVESANKFSVNDTSLNNNFTTTKDFFSLSDFIQGYRNNAGGKTVNFNTSSIVGVSHLFAVSADIDNVPTSDDVKSFTGVSNSYLSATFKDYGSVTLYETSSDSRLKKNIKDSTEDSVAKIEKIKHRSFNWKKDNKLIKTGYIAQEMEKIDTNFVNKAEIKKEDGTIDYNYQINTLYVLAETTNALQQLIKKDKEKDSLIEKLNLRIKKLEVSE